MRFPEPSIRMLHSSARRHAACSSLTGAQHSLFATETRASQLKIKKALGIAVGTADRHQAQKMQGLIYSAPPCFVRLQKTQPVVAQHNRFSLFSTPNINRASLFESTTSSGISPYKRNVFTQRQFSALTAAINKASAIANKMATHYSISVPTTPGSTTSSTAGSSITARNMSSHNTPSDNKSSSDSESLLSREHDLERGAEANKQGSAGGNGEPEGKKPSRFKVLMQQYGRVAILAYLLVSAIDLSLCIWAVWLGGDGLVMTINSYLGQYIPRLQKAAQRMEEGQSGGADKWATIIIVGYAVHKCLTPLRLAITAAILPWSARTAQRLGMTWLIPKSAPKITHKPLTKAADAIRHKLK
ncbi:DUF1279 super [Coemansia sp. RSA 485]|nr:DUF1279 super [Coemansia sp. RSA 485]